MLLKRNTFTDFIAVVEHLTAAGTAMRSEWHRGGSAGGLLMGAVANMRPELFRAVLSHVPFVDVMNTMLDASLPLTVPEYEEWGDPNQESYFRYMVSYSPYDNLRAASYPAMLVKTSLNDSQVMYWEPAKYVAKLRTLKTDGNPLLLVTICRRGTAARASVRLPEGNRFRLRVPAAGVGRPGLASPPHRTGQFISTSVFSSWLRLPHSATSGGIDLLEQAAEDFAGAGLDEQLRAGILERLNAVHPADRACYLTNERIASRVGGGHQGTSHVGGDGYAGSTMVRAPSTRATSSCAGVISAQWRER